MNRKRFVLIIPILVFIIILFIIDTLLPDENSNELEIAEREEQSTFSPIGTFDNNGDTKRPEEEIPNTEKINISNVEMDNFYKESDPINSKGDVLIADTPEYSIAYLKPFDTFVISIVGTSFEESKKLGEKALLRKLDINEKEACQLNVKVNTPRYAHPDLAGKTFKLSFCEN